MQDLQGHGVTRACVHTWVSISYKKSVSRVRWRVLWPPLVLCGDRVTCSTQVLMCNKRTHALVTLILSYCPSQPPKLHWNTLAKKSASSPCTNHPVRCPLCTKTVWSYCSAQHYADVHDTARHPHLMQIADAEQEAVLNWVPHKAKKKKKQGNARARADGAPFEATASSAPDDVASSSSCLPPKPLCCPKAPAPHPPAPK